jgi:hypothetical protein
MYPSRQVPVICEKFCRIPLKSTKPANTAFRKAEAAGSAVVILDSKMIVRLY